MKVTGVPAVKKKHQCNFLTQCLQVASSFSAVMPQLRIKMWGFLQICLSCLPAR